jgi:hypothetical protein
LLLAGGTGGYLSLRSKYLYAEPIIPSSYRGDLLIYIMAGQSNMSGRAGIAEEPDFVERTYVFGNDYEWHPGVEPVDDPTRQVDVVSLDESAGYGPGLGFAQVLTRQKPNKGIGLVPCAKGGSSIEEWQRDFSTDSLYGSCLARARLASQAGEIAGIIFFQGEQDALDPAAQSGTVHVDDYAATFAAFVTDFRNDLGVADLPVVYAQLGDDPGLEQYVNWAAIREGQAEALDQLSCAAMITTDDLLFPGVHFSRDQYREIGRRFAKAYLEIESCSP